MTNRWIVSALAIALLPSFPAVPAPGTPQVADALFTCPITQEVMSDPVIAADGYTYDRSAISKWLMTKDTSPMTNARLPHKELTPNHALRSSIMQWKESHPGN